MTTTAQGERVAVPWPLARRVVVGLARPGGAAMGARALEGAGLSDADRVVELSPGLGLMSAEILERDPRTWTGVEPDPLAAEHLRRSTSGRGREVVAAPIDATGLDDAAATVVVAEGVLSVLDDAGRAATLAEAARLLRAGGRLALHELTAAPGADGAALAELDGLGIRATGVDEWRACVERAGLVTVGSLVGRLDMPTPRDLMRAAGPRTALRITREAALDAGTRAAATGVRQALERNALALRSVVVVAEMPLVLGMRRLRR